MENSSANARLCRRYPPHMSLLALLSYPRRRLTIAALLGLTALQPVMHAASSLPSGGAFVAGSGNIVAAGNLLNINQPTLKGIIDWNTFSIANGAAVIFKN